MPIQELAALAQVLGALKAASELAKSMQSSPAAKANPETLLVIGELLGKLADARDALSDAKELVREKDETIRILQADLELRGRVVYEAPHYWVDEPAGRDGPFCQVCWDDKKKLIRMRTYDPKRWQCKACATLADDADYRPEPSDTIVPVRGRFDPYDF